LSAGDPEHGSARLVVVAEQHAGTLQQCTLSARDRFRQCSAATPPGGGKFFVKRLALVTG